MMLRRTWVRVLIAASTGLASGWLTVLVVWTLTGLRPIDQLEAAAFVVTIILPPVVAALTYPFIVYLSRDRDDETRCRKCGYILRGITEPRCPECGERI